MMTLERAITLASSADNGELNDIWREVVAALVAEVERTSIYPAVHCVQDNHGTVEYNLTYKVCHPSEWDMRTEEEKKGPLPASILADQADQIADALADFAMEVDIFNGLKYEVMVALSKHVSSNMVQFAKELRVEV